MANPITVLIPKNQWVLVATNVKCGHIKLRKWWPYNYYITYRTAGSPAPVGDQWNIGNSEKVLDEVYYITCSESMDIYMYCLNLDGEVIVAV